METKLILLLTKDRSLSSSRWRVHKSASTGAKREEITGPLFLICDPEAQKGLKNDGFSLSVGKSFVNKNLTQSDLYV